MGVLTIAVGILMISAFITPLANQTTGQTTSGNQLVAGSDYPYYNPPGSASASDACYTNSNVDVQNQGDYDALNSSEWTGKTATKIVWYVCASAANPNPCGTTDATLAGDIAIINTQTGSEVQSLSHFTFNQLTNTNCNVPGQQPALPIVVTLNHVMALHEGVGFIVTNTKTLASHFLGDVCVDSLCSVTMKHGFGTINDPADGGCTNGVPHASCTFTYAVAGQLNPPFGNTNITSTPGLTVTMVILPLAAIGVGIGILVTGEEKNAL